MSYLSHHLLPSGTYSSLSHPRVVRWLRFVSACLLVVIARESWGQPRRAERRPVPETESVQLFRLNSRLLTEFWGREVWIEAGVVLPPEHDRGRQTPICYSIHGFGGSHNVAWREGTRLREGMRTGATPRMIYVFLNAQFPLGHHEFADSVNNGPWGRALTSEFIPALEREYGGPGRVPGRFLTGHSSGGWSSLWLQVNYPDFFAGTWSTAPDPIDFRDFSGVDIYKFDNAYLDPQGVEIPLVRKRGGGWGPTIKGYAQQEAASKAYGGQFASFDAVFSPRAEDGRPMRLFDRETGQIDRSVVLSWRKYDIGVKLREQWEELGPKLRGKLHIYVGTEDTYRLEGAVILLKADLARLGSDAEVVIVTGRDHSNLLGPHPELWPEGLVPFIHRAMWRNWRERS